MANPNIKVIHFHNGCYGGVFSVIKNILFFSQNFQIENHLIYTINQDQISNFKIPEVVGAKSQQVFTYSPKWNFYFTCRQLSKLIPNENAIIVAHDLLELGMISNLGLNNPVIQMLHGDFDYYYNLAKLHSRNIDLFYCVSPTISKNLKTIVDDDKIVDWRFPIPNAKSYISNLTGINIAFFVADLTDPRKNYEILPKIDEILISKGCYVNWHIAGGGLTEVENNEMWNSNSLDRVFFNRFLIGDELIRFLSRCNVMILPSKSEGLPVSVVEAMKRELIPIVPFWNGAVKDLIVDGESGFYADWDNPNEFASKIELIYNNDILRKQVSNKAKQMADEIFNPELSVKKFELSLINLKPSMGIKYKAYGSRLDNEYIPNWITYNLRKLKK